MRAQHFDYLWESNEIIVLRVHFIQNILQIALDISLHKNIQKWKELLSGNDSVMVLVESVEEVGNHFQVK